MEWSLTLTARTIAPPGGKIKLYYISKHFTPLVVFYNSYWKWGEN